MIRRARLNKINEQLSIKFLRRHITSSTVSQAPMLSSGLVYTESAENRKKLRLDMESLCRLSPETLQAWFFSGRPESATPVQFLGTKDSTLNSYVFLLND